MKNRTLNILGMSAIFMILLFSVGCKKTSEPQYPQLIGQWLEITDPDTVSLYVDNVGGALYVTQMFVRVGPDGNFIRYSMSSTSGLAAINESNYFYLTLESGGKDGPTYLDGTFNPTTLVLSGTFAYYPLGDTVRVNYPYTIQRP